MVCTPRGKRKCKLMDRINILNFKILLIVAFLKGLIYSNTFVCQLHHCQLPGPKLEVIGYKLIAGKRAGKYL